MNYQAIALEANRLIGEISHAETLLMTTYGQGLQNHLARPDQMEIDKACRYLRNQLLLLQHRAVAHDLMEKVPKEDRARVAHLIG